MPTALVHHSRPTTNAASASATTAGQAQAAQANQLAQDAERVGGTTEALRAQMLQRSAQLGTRQEAAGQRKASSEQAASELPAGYRPDIPLTADRLADTLERIEAKRSELAKISEHLLRPLPAADQPQAPPELRAALRAIDQYITTCITAPGSAQPRENLTQTSTS